jgi:hypothetical protein
VFRTGETFTSETGKFTLTVQSLSDSGANVQVRLTGQSSIIVSPLAWSPPWSGATTSISVESVTGARWTAKSSASWLTIDTTSGGSASAYVYATAAANRSTVPRTGTITFTGAGETHTVTVNQAGVADDHGNTIQTATAWNLTASPQASGSLEIGNDIDYFRFTAPVSGTFTFTSNGTGNVSGYLYDAAGSQIAYNLDSGPGSNFLISRALTAGTQYYLAIRNSSSSASNTNTGAYTIAAVVPEPAVVGVSQALWSPVQTGGTTSVTVTTNQSSWSGVSSASWLTLSTRSGSSGRVVTLTASLNASTQARDATVTFSANGAVGIVQVHQPGAVDDHGSTVASATAWDIANSPTVAGSLELGNDIDYFRFTAPTTGSYKLVSAATGNVNGYLYNASGTQIAYNLDSGPGSNFQITYTLTAGQVYYVAIRNYSNSATNTNTGSYTITATRS